jgi:hypothetical protein
VCVCMCVLCLLCYAQVEVSDRQRRMEKEVVEKGRGLRFQYVVPLACA